MGRLIRAAYIGDLPRMASDSYRLQDTEEDLLLGPESVDVRCAWSRDCYGFLRLVAYKMKA